MYSMTQKLYNFRGGQHTKVELIKHSTKCEIVVKVHGIVWPIYGAINIYNVLRIFRHHTLVANCDRWSTYKGSQHYRFYCIYIIESLYTSRCNTGSALIKA